MRREGGREGGRGRCLCLSLLFGMHISIQQQQDTRSLNSSFLFFPFYRGMNAILKNHIFVGAVDDTFSLLQHDTKVLLLLPFLHPLTPSPLPPSFPPSLPTEA